MCAKRVAEYHLVLEFYFDSGTIDGYATVQTGKGSSEFLDEVHAQMRAGAESRVLRSLAESCALYSVMELGEIGTLF